MRNSKIYIYKNKTNNKIKMRYTSPYTQTRIVRLLLHTCICICGSSTSRLCVYVLKITIEKSILPTTKMRPSYILWRMGQQDTTNTASYRDKTPNNRSHMKIFYSYFAKRYF